MNNLINKINEWAISHGLDKGNPKIERMKGRKKLEKFEMYS